MDNKKIKDKNKVDHPSSDSIILGGAPVPHTPQATGTICGCEYTCIPTTPTRPDELAAACPDLPPGLTPKQVCNKMMSFEGGPIIGGKKTTLVDGDECWKAKSTFNKIIKESLHSSECWSAKGGIPPWWEAKPSWSFKRGMAQPSSNYVAPPTTELSKPNCIGWSVEETNAAFRNSNIKLGPPNTKYCSGDCEECCPDIRGPGGSLDQYKLWQWNSGNSSGGKCSDCLEKNWPACWKKIRPTTCEYKCSGGPSSCILPPFASPSCAKYCCKQSLTNNDSCYDCVAKYCQGPVSSPILSPSCSASCLTSPPSPSCPPACPPSSRHAPSPKPHCYGAKSPSGCISSSSPVCNPNSPVQKFLMECVEAINFTGYMKSDRTVLPEPNSTTYLKYKPTIHDADKYRFGVAGVSCETIPANIGETLLQKGCDPAKDIDCYGYNMQFQYSSYDGGLSLWNPARTRAGISPSGKSNEAPPDTPCEENTLTGKVCGSKQAIWGRGEAGNGSAPVPIESMIGEQILNGSPTAVHYYDDMYNSSIDKYGKQTRRIYPLGWWGIPSNEPEKPDGWDGWASIGADIKNGQLVARDNPKSIKSFLKNTGQGTQGRGVCMGKNVIQWGLHKDENWVRPDTGEIMDVKTLSSDNPADFFGQNISKYIQPIVGKVGKYTRKVYDPNGSPNSPHSGPSSGNYKDVAFYTRVSGGYEGLEDIQFISCDTDSDCYNPNNLLGATTVLLEDKDLKSNPSKAEDNVDLTIDLKDLCLGEEYCGQDATKCYENNDLSINEQTICARQPYFFGAGGQNQQMYPKSGVIGDSNNQPHAGSIMYSQTRWKDLLHKNTPEAIYGIADDTWLHESWGKCLHPICASDCPKGESKCINDKCDVHDCEGHKNKTNCENNSCAWVSSCTDGKCSNLNVKPGPYQVGGTPYLFDDKNMKDSYEKIKGNMSISSWSNINRHVPQLSTGAPHTSPHSGPKGVFIYSTNNGDSLIDPTKGQDHLENLDGLDNLCIGKRTRSCDKDKVCDAYGNVVGPNASVEKVGGPYVDLGGVGSLGQVLYDKALTDYLRKGGEVTDAIIKDVQSRTSGSLSETCDDNIQRPLPLTRWSSTAKCVSLNNRCGGKFEGKNSPSTPPDYLYSGGKAYASPRYRSSSDPKITGRNKFNLGDNSAPFLGTSANGLPYDDAGKQATDNLIGFCDNSFIFDRGGTQEGEEYAEWAYWKDRGRVFPSQYVSATSDDIKSSSPSGHAWGIPSGCFPCGTIDLNPGAGYTATLDSLASGAPVSTLFGKATTSGYCATGGLGSTAFPSGAAAGRSPSHYPNDPSLPTDIEQVGYEDPNKTKWHNNDNMQSFNKKRKYEPEGIMTDMGGQFFAMSYTQSEGQGGEYSVDKMEGAGPVSNWGGVGGSGEKLDYRGWGPSYGYSGPGPDKFPNELRNWDCGNDVTSMLSTMMAARSISDPQALARASNIIGPEASQVRTGGWASTSYLPWTPPGTGESISDIYPITKCSDNNGIGPDAFLAAPSSITGHLWAPRWMDARLDGNTRGAHYGQYPSLWGDCENGHIKGQTGNPVKQGGICECQGWVRYGNKNSWNSKIHHVTTDIPCSWKMFGRPANPTTDDFCQCKPDSVVKQAATQPMCAHQYPANRTIFNDSVWPGLFDVTNYTRYGPSEIPSQTSPSTKGPTLYDKYTAGRVVAFKKNKNLWDPGCKSYAPNANECTNFTLTPMWDVGEGQCNIDKPICICGKCYSGVENAVGEGERGDGGAIWQGSGGEGQPAGTWMWPPVPDRKFSRIEKQDKGWKQEKNKWYRGSWLDWGAIGAPYNTAGYGGFSAEGSGIGGVSSDVMYGVCISPVSGEIREGCAQYRDRRGSWISVDNCADGFTCSAQHQQDEALKFGTTTIYPGWKWDGRSREKLQDTIAGQAQDGAASTPSEDKMGCGAHTTEYFQDQHDINMSGYMQVYDVNGNPVVDKNHGPINAMQPADRLPNPIYLEKVQKKMFYAAPAAGAPSGIHITVETVPSYQRLPDQWSGSGWQQTMRMWPDAGVTQYINKDPGRDVERPDITKQQCINTWHSPLNDTPNEISGSVKANSRPYAFSDLLDSPRNVLSGAGCPAQKGPEPSGSGLNNIKGRNQWYQRWNIGKCSEDTARNLLASTWFDPRSAARDIKTGCYYPYTGTGKCLCNFPNMKQSCAEKKNGEICVWGEDPERRQQGGLQARVWFLRGRGVQMASVHRRS